jgi:hypothetical protein
VSRDNWERHWVPALGPAWVSTQLRGGATGSQTGRRWRGRSLELGATLRDELGTGEHTGRGTGTSTGRRAGEALGETSLDQHWGSTGSHSAQHWARARETLGHTGDALGQTRGHRAGVRHSATLGPALGEVLGATGTELELTYSDMSWELLLGEALELTLGDALGNSAGDSTGPGAQSDLETTLGEALHSGGRAGCFARACSPSLSAKTRG